MYFTHRHVGLLACRLSAMAPQGFLPAIGAEIQIQLARQERRLRPVGRLEIDSCAPVRVLNLHGIRAACRSMEADFAFPVADVGFWKALFMHTHFSTHIFGPVVSDFVENCPGVNSRYLYLTRSWRRILRNRFGHLQKA
jgi:hypothetical protein